MKRLFLLIALMMVAIPAHADDAGDFDYYVVALSWSPNWCVREGDARDSDQCDARHDYGWTLHGLWPQHETGYPKIAQAMGAIRPDGKATA